MFVFGKQQGCMYLRYYTSEIRIVTPSIFAFIKPSNEQFNKLNTFTGSIGDLPYMIFADGVIALARC